MVVLLEDKTHGIAGGNHNKRQKYVRQGTKHPFPVVASTFLPYWQQAQKVVRQQLLQSSKQPQRVACHKSIWLLLPPTVVTVVMVSGRSKCRSSQASQDAKLRSTQWILVPDAQTSERTKLVLGTKCFMKEITLRKGTFNNWMK